MIDVVVAPQRIQRMRARGWIAPPNTIMVTRPGPWGNPFIVGKHGEAAYCVELHLRLLAGQIALTDRDHIREQQKALHHFIDHLDELRGHNIGCWCAIGAPCHGDTLFRLANQ